MTRRLAFSLVATALGCGGCGGGTGMADMAMGAPDLVPFVPPAEICKTDNLPVQLAKKYGVRGTLTVNVKVPSDCTGDGCIFNKDVPASILLLADVTQTGLASTVTARPCSIQIPKVALKGQPMPTVLTAPDKLVQSVKDVTAMAKLNGPNTCAGFLSDPLAILLGTRLAAPATDPLPTFSTMAMPPVKLCGGKADVLCSATMDQACICDQENDEKVGATVTATGLPALDDVDRVYLALRTVVSLDGAIFPPSLGQVTAGPRIRGSIAGLKLEQSPVGCHRSPAGGGTQIDCDDATTNTIAKLNPLVTQSTEKPSTFVGMPVPDGYTCVQLVTDAATLFKGQ